jgi:hypothetical protein
MNKYLFLISLGLLFFSCQKALNDVGDYFPQLKMVSATVQADGTVLLEGEILSVGAAPIEYLGFCCNTNPNPDILDRQLWADSITGNKFSAVMSGFSPDEVYYFKAWATNEYGYAIGKDSVVLSGISAANVDPPCTLVPNSCNIGGGQPTGEYFNVSALAPNGSLGYWNLDALTSTGPTVNMKFGSEPATGVFTTTDFSSPGAQAVYVSFYSGFISGSLNSGSKVYVKRLEPGKFEIVICDAPWQYESNTFYFKTRLITPL